MTARAEQWGNGFAHLREFAERNGHARVPVKVKDKDGYPVGQWLSNQRRARGVMDEERGERLEALPGWTWDAYTSRWEEALAHLKMYVAREGDARVLLGFKTTEGYPLGAWVSTQRGRVAMPPERMARLEALPGWAWGDPREDRWEEGLAHLQRFVESTGHARVPVKFKTSGGFPLGRWVNAQRTARAVMPRERVERLEAVDGWTWNTYADQWDEGFAHLKALVESQGDARVSQSFRASDGFLLGVWVNTQRSRTSMTVERAARLEALPGWAWRAI